MKGLRIADLAEGRYLAFDLRDILAVIGPAARTSLWLCREIWCIPFGDPDDEKLAARYSQDSLVAGEELMALASETRQVIDGTFHAFREAAASRPWLIVRAVDSSFWEVFSDDAETLERLRSRFEDVRDIAGDAA